MVFHDATLREIATRLPGTVEELSTVGGVGEAKLAKYGDGILTALSAAGPAPAPAGSVPTPSPAPAAAGDPEPPYDDEPPFDPEEIDPPWDDWE